jgi:hypothetical protein
MRLPFGGRNKTTLARTTIAPMPLSQVLILPRAEQLNPLINGESAASATVSETPR